MCYVCGLGRIENHKNTNNNSTQMGSNGTHKKDTFRKRKTRKCQYSHWKGHAKKLAAHLKVKKINWKKSWFMVVEISALVPRYQRKKTEFNPSYGYGVFGKNAPKCTMLTHSALFCTLSLIAP